MSYPAAVPPITEPSAHGFACSYCGGEAAYRVWLDDRDFVGFSCDEPTHWAWVCDAVVDLDEEDE